MKYWGVLLCLACLSAGGTAQAAEAPQEVVIVSSRIKSPVPVSEHITLPTVITNSGAGAGTLLEAIPGVYVLSSGVEGSRAEIYFRGADANFTSLHIDGVPVADLSDSRGGAYDLSTVAGDELSGFNAGRGPLSALYGSGALTGVFDLRLDWPGGPDRWNGRYRAASGLDENLALTLGQAVQTRNGWQLAGLARYGQDGDQSLGTWRKLTALGARMRGDVADGRLTAFIRSGTSTRTGFDVASGGPLYSVTGERQWSRDQDTLGRIGFERDLPEGPNIFAAISFFRRDQILFTPATPDGIFNGTPASRQSSRFDRLQAVAALGASGKSLDYRAGIEAMDERSVLDGLLDFGPFALPTGFTFSRTTASLFGEIQKRATDRLVFKTALRTDWRDSDKPALSHRTTVQWTSMDRVWSAQAAWGHASKSPSFYALGDPLVGSPALISEISDGGEATLDYFPSQSGYHLQVSAHDTRYKNLIDFDFSTFKLINRAQVSISGIDALFQTPEDRPVVYRLRASRLYFKTDPQSGGLLHRPEWTAAVDSEFRLSPATRAVLSVRYVGERQSSSIPTGPVQLKSYVTGDVTIEHTVTGTASVSLRVGNITDRRYQSIAGFPASGRQVTISLYGRY